MQNKISTIIFDLGGVLIDWNPGYVFDKNYFKTKEDRDFFFNHICTSDWNEEQDAGRSIVEATQLLVKEYPDWEQAIRDYYGRWTEMLGGPIAENVEILRALHQSKKYKLYALTNWQADLFNIALVRYNFLHLFDGRVVSGEEKMRKPNPHFYDLLLNRHEIKKEHAVFIDDNLRNVQAAIAMGIPSIHYQNTENLKSSLQQHGITW